MRRIWLALLLGGCADPIVTRGWDGGVFFEISGPVEAGAAVTGERTRGAVAWVWLSEGSLGGVVEEVDFEPRVYSYGLEIRHPPIPDGGAPAPSDLDLGAAMLWGLPLLAEPPSDSLAVEIDPEVLLDWVVGEIDDPAAALSGPVVAVTPEHLLMGLDADGRDLSELDAWEPGGPWCAVDGMIDGLTLYRRDGSCAGWRALAEPGTRTAFQGVPMAAAGAP